MVRFLAFFALLYLSFAFWMTARACDFPINTQYYAMSADPAAGGVTKAEADDAIQKAHAYYDQVIAQQGAKLEIKNSWSDGTVNAQAYRNGDKWVVEMFGGLSRHPHMDKSSFMAVLCHEIGHHIGGFPRYGKDSEWASVEGQADFYSMECMHNLWPEKALPGGVRVSETLAELMGLSKPHIETPDLSIVTETYEGHPEPQCRLDTIYQSYIGGDRPRCWFAP